MIQRYCAMSALSALMFAPFVLGQSSTQPFMPDELTLESNPQLSPDSVDDDLAEVAQRRAGILKYGPVSLIDTLLKDANEALDKIGLHVGVSYTALYQVASGGPGQRDAAGG